MDLVRWDPFRDLREEIDRLFEDFSRGRRGEAPTVWVPPMDLEETNDAYIVRFEIPGMKREDLKISITEHTLTLSAERKCESEEKDRTVHRREIVYGKFTRSISFPAEIDPQKAKATYKDGILTVELPKSERAKPREIEIKVE